MCSVSTGRYSYRWFEESQCRRVRLKKFRSLLYLLQACFTEQIQGNARSNKHSAPRVLPVAQLLNSFPAVCDRMFYSGIILAFPWRKSQSQWKCLAWTVCLRARNSKPGPYKYYAGGLLTRPWRCVYVLKSDRGRGGSRHSNVAIGRAVCLVSICSVAVSIVGRSAHSALAIVQQDACCAAKDSRKYFWRTNKSIAC